MLFLIFFLGQIKVFVTGDDAFMKIHKKIKISIPEMCTFSALTFKVFETVILGLYWEKHGLSIDNKTSLLLIEPWRMRMQWDTSYFKLNPSKSLDDIMNKFSYIFPKPLVN